MSIYDYVLEQNINTRDREKIADKLFDYATKAINNAAKKDPRIKHGASFEVHLSHSSCGDFFSGKSNSATVIFFCMLEYCEDYDNKDELKKFYAACDAIYDNLKKFVSNDKYLSSIGSLSMDNYKENDGMGAITFKLKKN